MPTENTIPAVCTVAECERKPVGRGLCRTRYSWAKRHGTLPPTSRDVRNWNPVEADPIEVAYLAGIFDGEGSICISYDRARLAGQADDCFLIAVVTMSDEATVRRFYELFGGSFYRKPPQPGRPLFRWSIRSSQVAPFLATIGPLLKIKRAQAELAREFLSTRFFMGGSNRIPPGILAARESMRTRMSELNQSHFLAKRMSEHG